jgi:urease accessory protein
MGTSTENMIMGTPRVITKERKMEIDSDASLKNCDPELADLRLLHLADSALPIGGLAHSFGLESLVAEGLLGVNDLPEFLHGFLEEAGMAEAIFCREAFRLAGMKRRQDGLRQNPGQVSAISARETGEEFCAERWVELNDRLSALKPARESRAGSASLGRNFLMAVAALGDFSVLKEALEASKRAGSAIHHSPAFGLAGGVLAFEVERAVLAYLHQSMASLVSACQRLLPLGQSTATRILWDLKPAIIDAAKRSADCTLDDAWCFMPLLDWGAMEHPALRIRLFIS